MTAPRGAPDHCTAATALILTHPDCQPVTDAVSARHRAGHCYPPEPATPGDLVGQQLARTRRSVRLGVEDLFRCGQRRSGGHASFRDRTVQTEQPQCTPPPAGALPPGDAVSPQRITTGYVYPHHLFTTSVVSYTLPVSARACRAYRRCGAREGAPDRAVVPPGVQHLVRHPTSHRCRTMN